MANELHKELHSMANELHSELHTLASIANDLRVSKRAVQNWLAAAQAGEHGELGRLGSDKRRYFTDSERQILLSYASERAKAPKPASQPAPAAQAGEPAAEVAAITVIEGNHRSTLAAPAFGGVIDLGSQRGEITVQSYGDPMAAAGAALAVMATNINAMSSDLARQQDQLAQTAQAVAMLKQQAELMAAQQAEYRIKSDLIGMIQTQQTSELTSLLGKAAAVTGEQ